MSRHAAPMLVGPDGQASALRRLELGRGDDGGRRREAFVQDLVHEHPALIPMAEIEPAFSPLISVCRELPTPAGFLDNLWVTPWGGLVLGECKLVRNPQARREVVAQALDYARALAGWSYDDLEQAIGTALKRKGVKLWEFVTDQTDLDEAQFVDGVERRLRTGRFLLLIIGDGIQEGVEALTSHLQLHAGLHVGLALLDLSLWQGQGDELLVVPRVPMRTVLIERGIVLVQGAGVQVIDAAGASIGLKTQPGTVKPAAADAEPKTSSEAEFMDQLTIRRPELIQPLHAFLESVSALGVAPEYRKSLVLRVSISPDLTGSLGYMEAGGRVWLGDAWSMANRAGRPDAGDRYLEALAGVIGGSIRRYERGPPQVASSNGKAADGAALLPAVASWCDAAGALIDDLRATV